MKREHTVMLWHTILNMLLNINKKTSILIYSDAMMCQQLLFSINHVYNLHKTS